MPMYEYRCGSCGLQREFLRKVSDAPLTTCPECGEESLSKMLTAAGFQLKGSGWYATDFKGSAKPAPGNGESKTESKSDSKSDSKSESKIESKTESKTDTKTDSKPDAPAAGRSGAPACP